MLSIFSCRTSKPELSYLINISEANRILGDALEKAKIVDSSKDLVYFNRELIIKQDNIIYFDTTKIKRLDLNYFECVKKNDKIKLINKNEIKSDFKIIEYWNITFRKLNNGLLRIGIASDFYIPPSRQPIEIYGMYYYFNFKIVNGKAELIKWKGQ